MKWFKHEAAANMDAKLQEVLLDYGLEGYGLYWYCLELIAGKGSHTWMHPLLFIDMALAISPKIKIETYEWMFDQLIKSRNESGDSYKAMCGVLYVRTRSKTNFYQYVQEVARKIKQACRVTDWNSATEDQLKLRDKLHNDIALLADVLNNNDEAVRLAILKAVK